MNKVVLCGRLVRDPDVRYVNQGDKMLAIARYTLAVDRRKRIENGQNADFINCVCFDRYAEFCERYLKKGTKVIVSGHLQTGSYTNRDGAKVYTTEVVIEEQEFAESKGSSGSNDHSDASNNPSPSGEDFMRIPEGVDDYGLPFN